MNTMNRFILILLLFSDLLVVSTLTAEEARSAVLQIDSRPTFQSLTAANIRFLNPERPTDLIPTQDGLRLYSEPISLVLTVRGTKSEPVLFDQVYATFLPSVLQQPGRYYPPKLPVDPDTLLSGISLTTDVPLDLLPSIARNLSETLGLEWKALSIWIENELWNQTERITVEGAIPNGVAQLSAWMPKRRNEELRLDLTLIWNQAKRAQQGGAGEPATRAESDSEGGDKPKPESEGRSK